MVALVAAALLLSGCGRKDAATPESAAPAPTAAATGAAPATTATTAHLPPGIDWFDGDVDAAFATARESSRPLFLYWGAEWCPPCGQIKSTIFNRREFQERSRLFIPVYLDGDTPSAQKQGERFGIIGYPTMILFRPDGTEVTRLPGGVDIERYAKILDVALADARPVKEILATAAHGGEVGPDDWRLLAYYAWSADNGRALAKAREIGTFRALSERCPVELQADCARLYFEYLAAVADAGDEAGPSFTGLDRAAARKRLLELLAQPAVGRANVDNLLFGAKEVVGLLSDPGSVERRQLTDAWRAALDRLAAGDSGVSLSGQEQVYIVRARVLLAQLDAPDMPLPPALLDEARQTVARVDAATTDPYARQATVNASVNLYWEAGLNDDANRLLVAELDKAKTPYYFMLDLAESAEKAGRQDEAVRWLAKAYEGAEGPATRFQWGYSYLVGLIEMTPGDAAAIERTGLAVLGELGRTPDAFHQRTRMRLDQLSTKLLEWGASGDHAKVIESLRRRTGEICRAMPEGDEGRVNCERFLAPVATTTQSA